MFARPRNRSAKQSSGSVSVACESLEPRALLCSLMPQPDMSGGDKTDDRLLTLIANGSIAARPAEGLRVPTDSSGQTLTPLVTDTFDQAISSSDWWSSVHFAAFTNRFSAPLHVHPLTVQPTADGLLLGAPRQLNGFDTGPTTREYRADTQYDLQLTLFGGQRAQDFALEEYGDWSFTGRWQGDAETASLTLSQGSPVTWLENVDFSRTRIHWQSQPAAIDLDGARACLQINGQTYFLRAGSGARFLSDASGLSVADAETGSLSIALLPEDTPEMRATFLGIPMHGPASTQFSFEAQPAATTLRVRYDFLSGDGVATPTVLALYPHLSRLAVNPAGISGASYVSPRGDMQPTVTSRFEIDVPARGVLPNLPDVLHQHERDELGQLILADPVANNPAGYLSRFSDTYWSGKAMLKLCQLSQLADIAGEFEFRDDILNAVKHELDDWFTSSGAAGDRHFAWNETWNTLQGYPDSFGSADGLNDHHFHYGYFVHAAALVGLQDREWALNHRDMVDLLIMDVAGFDPESQSFPVLRNFSPMAGHSWASGHGAFGSGNNQESSSEAMNFATGMMLWGQVTGSSDSTSVGQLLYSLEAEAIAEYWFDRYDTVFPDSFHAESVGMVWGDGASHATWFSAQPELIKAINFLPFHGGSMYLSEMARDPKALLAEVESMNGGPADDWSALLLQYESLTDPEAAQERYDRITPVWEDGQSPAHTWFWLRSLSRLGAPTSTIRGDHPLSMVFESETGTTYTASNTAGEAITVHFSDGTSMELPANTERTMHRVSNSESLVEINSRILTPGITDFETPDQSGPDFSLAWPTPVIVMVTGVQNALHGNVAHADQVQRLEATLQHIDSGQFWTPDGQFGAKQPHQVRIVDAAGHWRLMFDPPAPGQWELVVTATDQNGASSSQSTTFNAVGETLVDPASDDSNPASPDQSGPDFTLAWPTPVIVMVTGVQNALHGNVAHADQIQRLEATLQHIDSGQFWTPDGQFGAKQPHQVRIVDTAGHWRLMFDPPAPGVWELIVTATASTGAESIRLTVFKAVGKTFIDPELGQQTSHSVSEPVIQGTSASSFRN